MDESVRKAIEDIEDRGYKVEFYRCHEFYRLTFYQNQTAFVKRQRCQETVVKTYQAVLGTLATFKERILINTTTVA